MSVQLPGQILPQVKESDLEDGWDSSREASVSLKETIANKQAFKVRPWHLFRFAGPLEMAAVVIGTLFAFAMGGAFPLFSIFFGDAVNSSIGPVQGSALDAMKDVLIKFAGLMVGMFACGFVWQSLLAWAAERQAAVMRIEYLKHVLAKDTAWFDAHEPASLPARMAMEVVTISDAIGSKLGMLIMSIGQFVIGLIVAFVKGWKLSLLMSSTIPVFAVLGVYMAKTISTATSDQQAWFAKTGAVAEEVLMAIRTVAAFGGESREIQRFEAQLGKAKRGGILAGFHMALSMGLMFGVMSAMYSLAFWYGAHHMIASGEASGAEVMVVFFSVFIGVSSLQQIGDPLLAGSKALSSASNMFAVFEDASEIEHVGQSEDKLPDALTTISTIELQQVNFAYPSRPEVRILKNLSFIIHKGQKVAFVGESGSGKSTIIQLMERFYDPSAGRVLVNGVQLNEIPVLAWRRQISYVGQEPVLFATSVLDNVKGGDIHITDEQAIEATKLAQAFEFLDGLPKKLLTFVGAGGGQMSGGQKQRIAIARALVKKPQVLLLDEATSALDNESEKMVQDTLDAIQTSGSCDAKLTTISVAHRLSTIRNADVIFVLRQGAVCEKGSHEELMDRQGEYFSLVQSQEYEETREVRRHGTNMTDISTIQLTTDEAKRDVSGSLSLSQSMSKMSQFAGLENQTGSQKELEEVQIQEMKNTAFKTPTGRLFRMMRSEWPIFVAALFAALVAGGVMPVNGRFLSGAMGSMYVWPMEDMLEEMNMWILLFGLAALLSLFGEFGKYFLFNYIQECLTMQLRGKAFSSLVCQEIGFFDNPRNGPAGLISMLSKQVSLVAQATGISLGNVVGAVLAFSVGLGLAFEGSWQLTLAILGACPVVMAAMVVVMKMMMPGAGESGTDNVYHAAYESATEAITNIRTVRALVAEQGSVNRFSASVESIASKEANGAWKKGLALGAGNAAMFVIYIIAFWYGSWLIDNGTAGEKMYQSLFCIMFGVMGAGMAATFMPSAVKAQVAAFETFRVIDRESDINAVAPSGEHRALGDGSIVFDHVRFVYPHRPELLVLSSLSFKILPGSNVAFVGSSGCGKSTVVQLIQRFYDPTRGDVKVGGVSLREFDVRWWRQQVGFVGQEPVLFDISLEDNVKYGKPDATRNEVEAAAQKANMDYVGNGKITWEDHVGPRGGKLSGGQKQRCAIARALIRDPSFLILDEATSALDSASEHVVQQALDAAKQGRTTISIAHRLSTIKNSDTIFVLQAGYMKEQGTHEELMKMKGAYWHLARRGLE